MSRPRKSGVNVVRKRRSDGTTLEYFYDRKTKRFLGHERAAAEQQMAAAVTAGGNPGTFAWLITKYLARPEFRLKLATRTQHLYRQYLDEMRCRYGDLPFRSFGTEAIEEIKSAFADHSRKANQIIGLFRILLGYAVKLRLIRDNPALRPEMLPTPPRTQVWSHSEEEAFLRHAPAILKLAFMLLIYTAQRISDVLAMTVGQVIERDGRLMILLRQQKTAELVAVPLHDRLAPLVRERISNQQDTVLLVPSPTGRRWLLRNFSRAWDEVARAAGIQDRQRRDCRRTAVVRLAEAGATIPQIAAVTGWGIDYCQKIVDTYLPRRTEVALGAVLLWERAKSVDSKIVSLGLAGGRDSANHSANCKPVRPASR